MYSVRFLPADRIVNVAAGSRLSDVAVEVGLPIRTDCGANGGCGKCSVILRFPDGSETKQLACRTFVDSDLDVTIPQTSLAKRDADVVVQLKTSAAKTIPEPSLSLEQSRRFGAAFDIGTTTLAMELIDRNGFPRIVGVVGRANPQRMFGDDIISRIQKVVDDPTKLPTMQEAVRETTNEMLRKLSAEAGIATVEIDELVVAGNTVMEYLFLGIDPSPLGFVPFTPPISVFPERRAEELGLEMNPNGIVQTLPILGGFVGGDLTAGVLAMEIVNETEPVLLIDIGTNGELVLWTGKELLAAATAAGPAFEGARIEHGTLAVPGAIERVDISSSGDVSVRTIGQRPSIGICGSGLIDAVSELLHRQLMKPNGRFNPETPSKHWKTVNGKPVFLLDGSIYLTQRDVQQLQLAGGAIRAGTELLLQHAGLTVGNLKTLYVAGGFGSFIAPQHARRIGLLPPELPLERIRFCGNTSLAGARRVLIDGQPLNCPIRHLELATFPEFTEVFARSMIFPVGE